EAAAIGASHWVGKGDKIAADDAAVKQMRSRLNAIDFKGKVVIGEGEKDKAPMLFIGEDVGNGKGQEFDLAIDPLEGTNLTAKGLPNALCVLAAGPKGSLLHAPNHYMEKIAAGPKAKGKISLDYTVEENIHAVARALEKKPGEVTVIILERERHNDLVKKVRAAGARIMLIPDGDISPAIATAIPGSGVDLLLGTGGAPEGVISAAALKCLDGTFEGRLVFGSEEQRKKAKAVGLKEGALLEMDDLARGNNLLFAATGVTDGTLLKGVRFEGKRIGTHSLVMRSKSKTIRFIEAWHSELFQQKVNP
ncbi:TPA: class II fructose-bisphosphatase, partial [Candidatus Micrarchaeota archaeon]|nr:class II fructose-bisphosphatase [Candidatus Micrarchaeota archaeon]